jgi:hypothetical protein
MDAVQRKPRAPAEAPDRALYQWAFSVALIATLAYIILAAMTLRDTVDGTPVAAIDATWPYWAGTAVVALVAGGLSQALIGLARPRGPVAEGEMTLAQEDQRRGTLAWVLPAVATVASILLVRLYHTTLASLVGALIVLVTTTLTIITHYHLRDLRPVARNTASITLSLATHAIAFFLLTMIYSNKWRSLYSASAIAVATMLLLLQMSDGIAAPWLRRLLYALIGGLLLGQMTWALNYWAATGWTGGAMLLALFYSVAGLTSHAMAGRLDRRIAIEYTVVLLVAFTILTVSVSYYR